MARSKYAMRRDNNEKPIIEALREFGASVIMLDEFDLLVGYMGVTHLIEIKNPEEDWSLTKKQRTIINEWTGSPLHVVTNSEAAINIITRAVA